MSAKILVCVTCDRYAGAATMPTPGERLAKAMRDQSNRSAVPTAIRSVECLSNCPNPCAAALRAPGKTSIRFCKLTVDDAAALLVAANAYAQSRDGDIALEAFPTSLRERISDRISVHRD